MIIISLVVFFFGINHRKCPVCDMSIFDENSGTFYFCPMIYGSIGVAKKIGSGIKSQSFICPIMYSISGSQMVCLFITPRIDNYMIVPSAVPQNRIFEVRRKAAVNRITLNLVGPCKIITGHYLSMAFNNHEFAVIRTYYYA